MADFTHKEQVQARLGSLRTERSSWMTHWQDLSQNILPRNGRFVSSDRNRGGSRTNGLLDNTATRGARTLAAGMLGGLTSPARPWLRVKTEDDDLNEYQPVKLWLAEVTRRMLASFSGSNTYRALHGAYEELGVFGTSATTILDDFDSLIHMYGHTVGEFMLATNYRGQVDTFYREFEITVDQCVREFGLANCSNTVKNLWTANNRFAWIKIVHVVEPRTERNPQNPTAQHMAWKSCYFEAGDSGPLFLREGGYKRFRVLAPRWITTGQDVYGQSPGMEVLGDVKQLQHEQFRKSQGIDYQTRPPLQGPSSMKNMEVDMLPGGLTLVDTAGANMGLRPTFEANINLNYLLEDIRDVRERINAGFYSDLFLMLANQDNRNMTATEVAERHEEKLLMLGPVLERLHNELLDPLVEITFERMLEAGVLPPPPEELDGLELNVEFVSILAQAQRAVGTNSVDRFVGNLGVMAQLKPDVLDKFDADQWVDVYADSTGVDPSLIVADEKVALIRQTRAQEQQAAAAQQQAAQLAESAAKLGTVDTGGRNAAADIMNQLSGYGSPGAQTY